MTKPKGQSISDARAEISIVEMHLAKCDSEIACNHFRSAIAAGYAHIAELKETHNV